MLSWTHAIFHGLQDLLADSLQTLPDNTPSWLKLGLMHVHCKLSDYYGKLDESPYYTCASGTLSNILASLSLTNILFHL